MREDLGLPLTGKEVFKRRLHHLDESDIDNRKVPEILVIGIPIDGRSVSGVDSQRVGESGITLLDGTLGVAFQLRRLARGCIDRGAAGSTRAEVPTGTSLYDEVLAGVVLGTLGWRVTLGGTWVSADTFGFRAHLSARFAFARSVARLVARVEPAR